MMTNGRKGKATDLYNVEQFCDDCCYSTEEGGSTGALHLMAAPLDLDKGTLLLCNVLNNTGRVHLLHVRQKDGRRGASDDGSGLHVLRF